MTRSLNGVGLPRPRRDDRWQPLRSGLLNLYRYDDEEFWFEDGHLLLRGNNGTGKSRVLALQLPFLLDGEVMPHRVEPDGDVAKRMEWNLLLDRHADRLGYTWLEFGRLDGDQECYFTIGCGLRAAQGRGLTGKWFFVTDRRIGRDFSLLTGSGAPLTRNQLAEALGENGEMPATAAAYRAAVDARLFGLGARRYEALINLLIQLRQPQLSRQLDEKRLSNALSEALPPLSPQIIADVADAFRSLEDDRKELDGFVATGAAVTEFLRDYRRYGRIACRRAADKVRSAHDACEETQRRLDAEQTKRDEATAGLEASDRLLRELAVDEERALAELAALQDSPEMRTASELDRIREDAERGRERADEAGREAGLAREAGQRRAQDLATSVAEGEQADRGVSDAIAAAGKLATALGMDSAHAQVVSALADVDAIDASMIRAAREAAARRVDDRRRALRHAAQLAQAAERAGSDWRAARQAAESRAADAEDARVALDASHARLDEAITALIDAYAGFAPGAQPLSLPDVDLLEPTIREWAQAAEGADPIARVVAAATASCHRSLAADSAGARQELRAARDAAAQLASERDTLAAGTHREPPPPHTRASDRREAAPGAPLWRLCELAPDVDPETAAGLEAALEAAGLLDAWVTPDGALIDPHAHDTWLIAPEGARPADHPLARFVVPGDPGGSAISTEVVGRILGAIGAQAGDGELWVAADGRWRVGPLSGAWTKPSAEYLGRSARDAARARRLDQLGDDIERAAAEVDRLERRIAEFDSAANRADAAARGAPSADPVRAAVSQIGAAGRQLEQARTRLADADQLAGDRELASRQAASELRAAARDLGIERWLDRLEQLEDALADYRDALGELWSRAERRVSSRAEVRRAREAADEAAAAAGRLDQEAHRAQMWAEARSAEYATLESSVGAAVAEVLRRLEEARKRVKDVRARHEAERDRRGKLDVARAVAETHAENYRTQLEVERGRRDAGVALLERYASARLLTVAHDQLVGVEPGDWSVARAVDVARRIESLLSGVNADDAAWDRAQRAIHGHYQALTSALLPHGYQPSGSMEGEVFVVVVPFRGTPCSVAELSAAIEEEIASRRSLLDAREREVIENHLVGEVSLLLHDLLRSGEELVLEMNNEIRARPNSTGMTLQFVWEPDVESHPRLADARQRLLRAGGTWSDDDRQALGEFLRDQIRLARERNDAGTWQAHLETALDYRAWHRFSVERYQDGRWKRLTRRTHGTGSGGEKAIALTIPQFAAAAAHYRSAAPHAPRLILLDEAFVGVDGDMRQKCMGLLSAFDLDFVMTSEREWGCYPTLPGLAIYQLATRTGIDAIGVTRWVWNGLELKQLDHDAETSAAD